MVSMYKMISKLYLMIRNIKSKQYKNNVHDFYIYNEEVSSSELEFPININGKDYYREETIKLFYGENLSDNNSTRIISNKFYSKNRKGVGGKQLDKEILWWKFIEDSKIPKGFLNSDLYQTGYCLDKDIPVLSSWIWTSAAISRVYFEYGVFEKCIEISDAFLELQTEDGGWIVRNDQDYNSILPAYAPNDSAYIARHALLNAYKATNNRKYLNAAERCANWIIDNTLNNGLIPTNLFVENQNIIVDIGFTLSLFAELFRLTGDNNYLSYLKKFSKSFVKLFFNSNQSLFCTSIDKSENQIGGFFSRGQAWALEGLIDSYMICLDNNLHEVIQKNIRELISRQNKDGSWHYNFSRRYLGVDNKGVAVIANAILNFYPYADSDLQRMILGSAELAIEWCKNKTKMDGIYSGGIFDFCFEGAITKYYCTETAFVYSNAYALIINKKCNNLLYKGMKD